MNLLIKYLFLVLNQFFGQLSIGDTPLKGPPFDIEFEKTGLAFPEPVVAQGVNAVGQLLPLDKKTLRLGREGRVRPGYDVKINYQADQQQEETQERPGKYFV
jgi:hypothetical protein